MAYGLPSIQRPRYPQAPQGFNPQQMGGLQMPQQMGRGFNPAGMQGYGGLSGMPQNQSFIQLPNYGGMPPQQGPPQNNYAPGENAPGQPFGRPYYNPYETPTRPGWNPSEGDFRLGSFQDLNRFRQAGYFDPEGNRRLIEAGRQQAGNIAGGFQRQSQLAAQASGMDPTQRASYWQQAMLGGQGQYANSLNQALMDAWRRQADFAQQMQGQAWGAGQRQPDQHSPSFGDYLGQAAGSAAGALPFLFL